MKSKGMTGVFLATLLVLATFAQGAALGTQTFQWEGLQLRQALGDIDTKITENDLPALMGGEVSTPEGTTEYRQGMRFEWSRNEYEVAAVNYVENNDDVMDLYLTLGQQDEFFQWTIEFRDGLVGRLEADDIEEFEGVELNALGETWEIILAELDEGMMTLIFESQQSGSTIEFTDSTGDGEHDGHAEVNNENIGDGSVSLEWSEEVDTRGPLVRLSRISYRAEMDPQFGSDMYIPAGESLREHLDQENVLLSEAWDVHFDGVADDEGSYVQFDPRGDDEYRFVFENVQGEEYSFILVSNEGGNWKLGDDKEGLHYIEGQSETDYIIIDDDLFIVSNDRHPNDQDKSVTNVLEYDDYDNTDFTLDFQDIATGNIITVPVNVNGTGSLVVGGHTYEVRVDNRTSDSPNLAVDLNSDGDIAGDTVTVTTLGGAIVSFAFSDEELNVKVAVLEKNFEDADGDEALYFVVYPTENDQVNLDFDAYAGPFAGGENWNEFQFGEPSDVEDDRKVGMTDWGVFISLTEPEDVDEPRDLTLTIPSEQVLPMVSLQMEA